MDRDLRARVEQLSPEKQALLKQRLRQRSPSVGSPIRPRDRGVPAPLSSAQERLFFLAQLEPDNPFYNVMGAIRLRGLLRVPALEQSIIAISQRHESLRTTFVMSDGELKQVISPYPTHAFEQVDLSHVPDPEGEMQRLANEEAKRPFDLTSGSLFRLTLLQLGQHHHVLFLSMHHIVSDGWSLSILTRELCELYDSFLDGRPSSLSPLSIQYADYAGWQQQWLSEPIAETHLSYWKTKLGGHGPILNLPADHVRPSRLGYRGARMPVALSPDLWRDVRKLSRNENVTPFMMLLAAYKALLYRYTGQEHLFVGSPVANRTRPEVEALVGCFVNTLVLRTDMDGRLTFRELLGHVKRICLEAYAHQDLPFEKLVQALQPARRLDHAPLFQTMFVLQTVVMPSIALRDLTASFVEITRSVSLFDLTLELEETPQGATGFFEYNTDLFDSDRIDRMKNHWNALLEGLVKDPSRRIDAVPLMREEEQRRVSAVCHAFEAGEQPQVCLHDLVEARAQLAPDVPAIVWNGESLSYRMLADRANRLAHHLRALGVGPEVRVGLYGERSLEMVVGILGILKAGGVCVPLDPSHPLDRLNLMIADVRPAVVVTVSDLASHLPPAVSRIVCLDSDRAAIAAQPDTVPACQICPDHPAFMLYTSGSTGRPKGVVLSHRSLVSYIITVAQQCAITASDRVLQFASLGFDVAIEEMFMALHSGATLVLRPSDLGSMESFMAVLDRERITVADLPTAFWHAWVQSDAFSRGLSGTLRLVMIGGEAALPTVYAKWAQNTDAITLMNLYGPAETTISASFFRCESRSTSSGTAVPIGRPFSGVRTFLLDDRLAPVPIGLPGELFIGGHGVARGYWSQPALTAERFIPDPFSGEAGARLYRTGDLCRYRADGVIEFLGRVDRQVKIRGYRIEPREIETALRQHEAVVEAALVTRDEPPGDKRLIAYVQHRTGNPIDGESLRRYLTHKLPNYMVPAHIVVMDRWPLTPNGKIDRRALPLPEVGYGARPTASLAPRTITEELLASIWAEILGVESVRRDDDFFALGGHSLLATQLVSRVLQIFQVELPVRALFECPTLTELANRIDSAKERHGSPQSMKIVPVPRHVEPVVSFAQERLWFLDKLEPGNPFYNVSGAFHAKGKLRHDVLVQSLTAIVRRHEVLRTNFPIREGRPIPVVHEPDTFPVPTVDLRSLPIEQREREVTRRMMEESERPFDLAQGRLLRVVCLQLTEDEQVLLVTMHHIISDGWSIGLLIREVSSLYDAFASGSLSPLIPLSVQYTDFARWQRQHLTESFDGHMAYWRHKLGGDLPILDVPCDRPRPAEFRYQGRTVPFVLSATLSKALRTVSHREGVTLFITILTAFKILLFRYTRQMDLLVGTPIANRTRAELEGLIGFFVNSLVLRTEMSGELTVRDLLRRVRETCLEAYAHQDLPFEKLVDVLKPNRDLSRTPLFQVMLAFQNLAVTSLELKDVIVTPLEMETRTTPFDLVLDVDDSAEELKGIWQYNIDLFDEQTVQRMSSHWVRLLEAMVAEPKSRVSDIPMLSLAERTQVLVEWNATEMDCPATQTIQALFEAQVARTPEATAVSMHDVMLTYRELNARSNRLAAYLRRSGVGPESRIALFVERSPTMVIAAMAVMKAGAAYVPLDPTYPVERLKLMLSGCSLAVLSGRRLLDALGDWGGNIVILDEEEELIGRESSASVPCPAGPDNLAYVIYTSGSSGVPKGVMVTHRSLVNAYFAWETEYRLHTECRHHLQMASFSFDVCSGDFIRSLCSGGKLVICPRELLLSPADLYEFMTQEAIDCAEFTPMALRGLVRYLETTGQQLTCMQVLAVGSDTWSADEYTAALKVCRPGTRLIHSYGITEATIDSTYFERGKQIGSSSGTLPIGRPFPNTKIYLLDENLTPVPVGVTGELHIAGEGLARGYLVRPDLTAEKFLPNPFSSEPGTRMYKSGDLARYLPDGNIEYLGRIDHQVKIRGFRIELGEIEAALRSVPGVREAVVLAREDSPGDKRLVGYVGVKEKERLEASSLRHHLSKVLPEYMVPAQYVFLEQFPLTPNGKLNRKTLPAPEMTRGTNDYVAPRTPMEAQLAHIWAEVLQLDKVGMEDNFFALGGHSLLAITVLERMRQSGVLADVRTLFTAPTVAALAAAVGSTTEIEVPQTRIPADCAHLTPDMLPLVPLTSEELTMIERAVPGGARNIQDIYPLAPLQEGILFHHLMQERGDAYIMPTLLGFETRERLETFVAALQRVIDRHDILRTAILWEGLTEPVQVVWRQAVLSVEEVVLEGDPKDKLLQLQARYSPQHYRMDVRLAPMVQGFLTEDPVHGRWLLQLLSHHLVCDHTALDILVEETQAILQGRAEQLPAALPFRNFVAQARLGVRRVEHEAFFTQMLGDVEEPTLPFGLRDVQGNGSQVSEAHREVESRLAQRIRQQARRLGVSAASVMHLAWARVLACVSGRQDVVFGTVLFGRMHGGLGADRALGLFINTLPIRIDVDAKGVGQSVQAIHARLTRLLHHEHASLALAQRCSGVPAPLPLFSALLNYRYGLQATTADAAVAQQGWEGMVILGGEEWTNYPVTLSVDDLGEGFELTAQVSVPIEAPRVCTYMHTVLEHLVHALETEPETPVHQLEVLSEIERREIVQSWNGPTLMVEWTGQLQERFEVQVVRNPEAVAVVAGSKRLTYSDLNRRANRLARRLHELGVGPEGRVGLCVERSAALIVGIVGILKAGGAYVPLDPTYPAERLAYMMADAGIEVLVTQPHVRMALPTAAVQIVDLDAELAGDRAIDDENVRSGGSAANLAYVMFTSGSTGRPKGVMVTHQCVGRLFTQTEKWFQFEEQDVWTLFHSYAFDFSVWELWGALLYGGRVVVVAQDVSREPAALAELIRTEGVTVLNQTPGAFRQLVGEAAALPSLRLVIFGGEALILGVLQPWMARYGETGPQLVNMYGITETTVHVTYCPLTATMVKEEVGSVIGQRIPDLRIYVLDARMNIVPVGVQGELYVGGAGVARGYWRRPGLTAERFVPDPFGVDPGARLYRTGDVGRYRADGTLEYLGRADQQVKIRGHRIEVGEIEAALGQWSEIAEAVVVVREDRAGEKRLVAYVVPQAGRMVTVTGVRAQLKAQVPDYMIPGTVVVLERLPLTVHGKVDRRALPAPAEGRPELDAAYVVPRTPVETTLAEIWAQVLEVDRVGIHDNFFALGGDSITSLRIVAAAKGRGLDMKLSSLYRNGTIALVADEIGVHDGAPSEDVPVLPGSFSLLSPEDRSRLPEHVDDAYPLSMLQAGMIFHSEYDHGAYHVVDSMRLQCPCDETHLADALAGVMARHPVLRTSIDLSRYSEPLQIVHRTVPVPLTVEDLRFLPAVEQERAIHEWVAREKQRSFQIGQAPLFRIHIHRLTDETIQFSISEHHAILDGWSLNTFLAELFEDYFARIRGMALAVPPLSLTYRDFIAVERRAIDTEEIRTYWEGTLRGRTVTMLEHALSRRAWLDTRSGWDVDRTIPVEVGDALRELARAMGVPLRSVLLAAHLRVLAVLTGQQDVSTGVVTNVRQEEADGERVLGLFLNTLPFPATLTGGSWVELIRQVFEEEQTGQPFRSYPLALLQKSHGAELFDSTFTYVHYHVLDQLSKERSIALLDWQDSIQQNFTLETVFYLDVGSPKIGMQVSGDPTKLADGWVAAIADFYCEVLVAMAMAPSSRYDTLAIGSSQVQAHVVALNATEAEYPRQATLPDLIEAQVVRTPDAVAVEDGETRLTYGELNRKANRVARILQGRGIRPGVIVGVCLSRTVDLPVGLLGILKAGGAYVPLEAELPSSRLSYILEDAGPLIVLTERSLLDRLPPTSAHVMCLDDPTEWEDENEQNVDRTLHPTDLAYILYTSGTTGRPKGVAVIHAALVNFLTAMSQAPGMTSTDTLLAVTTLAFDIAGLELYLPLIVGGRLVLADRETARDGQRLIERLGVSGATLLQGTPATWRMLLESGWKGDRQLTALCGGEALSVELAHTIQRYTKSAWNLYGPTETTIWSSSWLIQSESDVIPLGQPIANTQLYVLDQWLNPVPPGVAGELYIGGAGLARGYWNQSALTAERFIPDAYSGVAGARLYRTGDWCRLWSDGKLEYLGRRDHQIKLRGYRIELREIEAVLALHPDVREAVVVAYPAESGDQRLAAYVAAHGGGAMLSDSIRALMKDRLPGYMLPETVVVLEALPRTPSGKIDRAALPRAEADDRRQVAYVAPQTAIEEVLAMLWADVLNRDQVGIHGDFFELGGHSLTATRLVSKIREIFTISIPLRTIFETPTVAGLAERMLQEFDQAHRLEKIAELLLKIQQMSAADVDAMLEPEQT
jgi:amino acid adenylation domain-containing protein